MSSKSIIGCLASVGSYTKRKRLYLYQCFVDSDSVIQPTEKQVNDSIWTGEEWIVAPATMELVTILLFLAYFSKKQRKGFTFRAKYVIIYM